MKIKLVSLLLSFGIFSIGGFRALCLDVIYQNNLANSKMRFLKKIDKHYIFNNTYIGTIKGCKVYFTGTITFCDDGTYFVQQGSSLNVDCRPKISIMAKVNEEKNQIIVANYIDTETGEHVNQEDTEIIDTLILGFIKSV